MLVFLKFGHFSCELKETWSSGATECGVWIGNCNVKVWKSTEHKLHNIWRSVKFQQNEHNPRVTSYLILVSEKIITPRVHLRWNSMISVNVYSEPITLKTRMHFSRMRTVRFSSRLLGLGGGVCSGWVPAYREVYARGGGGCCSGQLPGQGVCSGGGGVCSGFLLRGCLVRGGWYPNMHWGRSACEQNDTLV